MNDHELVVDAMWGYDDDLFFLSIKLLDLILVENLLARQYSPQYVYKDKTAFEFVVHVLGRPHYFKEKEELLLSLFLEHGGQFHTLPNELKLKLAIMNEDTTEIAKLLTQPLNLRYVDGLGKTFLNNAISSEKEEILHMLLKAGADVDQTELYRITPLMSAVLLQKEELVKVLLSEGADPNCKFDDGKVIFSVLTGAKRRENKNIISMLENAGAVDHPEK